MGLAKVPNKDPKLYPHVNILTYGFIMIYK